MGIQAAPEVKFKLIQEAMAQDGAMLDVSKLCRLAGVSRSGYYNWLNSAPKREAREAADKADFDDTGSISAPRLCQRRKRDIHASAAL